MRLLRPACVGLEEATGLFGWPNYFLPFLVRAGHLKPLGNPPRNSIKFFATREVQKQAQDRAWLARVTNALNQHWQKNNSAKRQPATNGQGSAPVLGLAGGFKLTHPPSPA